MTTRTDARRARAATTQSLLRDVNDRILDLGRGRATGTRLEFVCECRHDDCQATLALTAEEYALVRASMHGFALKPGHEERVVDDRERVVSLEKARNSHRRVAASVR